MRISGKQNALRNPLNDLLGSRANVRLLRVLSHEVGEPLSAADAAKRAGLTPVGARKALAQLVRGGFVVRIGGGTTKQYTLRANETLLSILRSLFSEEEARYDLFQSQLRGVLLGIPELHSAWIDKMPTELGQALEMVVVVETNAFPWIRGELRTQLLPLESEFDQVIEIATFTRADAPEMGNDALIIVVGGSRDRELQPLPVPTSHSDRHDRTLRLSRSIAELLTANPSIIKRAQRHVARLLRERPGTAGSDLLEWQQILESYSPERIRELLVSTASRATRLRQSSPFFAVLTPDERDTVLKSYESQK